MKIQDIFETGDLLAIQELNDTKQQGKKIKLFEVGKDKIVYGNKKPFGVFYCPNPMKNKSGRNTENVKLLNALFCDIDNGSFETVDKFPIRPHYILTRDSDTHFHLLWLLDRPEANEQNQQKYNDIVAEIIKRLNGDKQVKSIAGLLRIPGTKQYKLGEGGTYTAIEQNAFPRYKLDELHSFFAPVKVETQKKEKRRREKNITEITDDQIFDFLTDQYRRSGKKHKGDGRSRFLFFVGLDCHKWGVDENDAIEYAKDVNEKYCVPPENIQIVTHQIKSAYKYSRDEFGNVRSAAEHGDTDEEINKYRNEIRIRDRLKEWVFIASIDRLINLKDGMELTTITQIDNYIAYICSTDMKFRTILKKQLIRVVEKIDFRPDIQKRIFRDHTGTRTLNRFSQLKIYEDNAGTKDKKAINIFENHLDYLSTNRTEFEALRNYMAYIIQNPGAKLPYAVLIISRYEGIGKSMLEMLFRNIFHSITGINYVGSLENEQLSGSYTHFLADRILCFVHELSQGDKYHIMNRFKNLITESTVEINAKYAKPYTIKNTTNFIMFSNKLDALKIDKNDRRMFVIYNDKTPKEQKYYSEIVRVFDEHYISIFNYLKDIDLTDFNPFKRPDMTEGKRQLIEQGESELTLYLDELRENKEPPFDFDFIMIADLQEFIEASAPNHVRNRGSVKALKSYLLNNDFVSTKEFIRVGKKAINRTFWHSKEIRPTKDELTGFLKNKNSISLDDD